jgi:hypothetical protein
MGKTETISSKVRKKTQVIHPPLSIHYISRIPSQNNKTRKKIKGIRVGNKEVKLSLFPDDMILCLKDANESTKKLLDLKNTFGNVVGHKLICINL